MNTRERFVRTLTGQDTDRVPFMKIFGGTNAVHQFWENEYPGISHSIDKILKFEGRYRGWDITPVNFYLSGVPNSKTIEENDNQIIQRCGDGSLILIRKNAQYYQCTTIEYPVKTPNDWDRIKSQFLDPYDKGRIPENWDSYVESYSKRDYPIQLTSSGVYGFARKMMGDEALGYAIYDEPDMVKDMMSAYTDMCIKIWEILCCDVDFDLIECWEDMASKTGSIISPATFNEFMAPEYRKIRSFADAHKIPIVLVDSDGYIDNLAPLMYESGVNAMYPFEAGAGCDVIDTLTKLPKMGALGCLEKNACALGRDAIDEQIEIARKFIKFGRIIPGPDHFVLSNVTYENYSYFMNRLHDVIMYEHH